MIWKLLHPRMTGEHLGLLPGMLNPSDPRKARDQFDAAYQHGGGWRPFAGFKLLDDNSLAYPGDPPQRALAETWLRDERILLYESEWVAIIQPDGSFEVCRMD